MEVMIVDIRLNRVDQRVPLHNRDVYDHISMVSIAFFPIYLRYHEKPENPSHPIASTSFLTHQSTPNDDDACQFPYYL